MSSKPLSPAQTPVPVDYVVGPGDTVRIQLYGNQTAEYELEIDRDGVISFPELGPITVAGLSFDSMRKELERRVEEQLIGTQISATLGRLRSINVFLAGDVEQPGSYTVDAQSTIVDVLIRGGGIADTGSLRQVRLMRGGELITRLDLYQLLLFGDNKRNRRVSAGDVVLVEPVGAQVTVAGEVRRPAIYEIRDTLTAEGALTLAGGAASNANLAGAHIRRSDSQAGIRVIDVDLSDRGGLTTPMMDGDVLVLPARKDRIDSAVSLFGHVFRPGLYEWHEGLTLSELLPSSSDLLPMADESYILVRREPRPNGTIETVSADLGAIWTDASPDLTLASRDQVYVFSRSEGREAYLEPLLDELRTQASSARPTAIVRIGGQVREPGEYPFEIDMTVADLIRAGGGLTESAYRQSAELTRFTTDGTDTRETELITVDLADALAGNTSADLPLRPFDFVTVKEITRWESEEIVEIRGEVAFPGEYPIYRGETLSSVLRRAGGLTEFAFADGAIFTRELLKEREREQLDSLRVRIESDLAALALSDSAQTEALSIGRSLLDQIEDAEPAGRLVIDLDALISENRRQDVYLRDGDELLIPPRSQEVTVIGEVQYATSHLWDPRMDRNEYIQRSGGVTVKADERRIYVVRANGEVVVGNRSRFFSRSRGFDMRPGDTIVVPLDTDRVKPIIFWSSATQILYNLAIAAAAVNSF